MEEQSLVKLHHDGQYVFRPVHAIVTPYNTNPKSVKETTKKMSSVRDLPLQVELTLLLPTNQVDSSVLDRQQNEFIQSLLCSPLGVNLFTQDSAATESEFQSQLLRVLCRSKMFAFLDTEVTTFRASNSSHQGRIDLIAVHQQRDSQVLGQRRYDVYMFELKQFNEMRTPFSKFTRDDLVTQQQRVVEQNSVEQPTWCARVDSLSMNRVFQQEFGSRYSKARAQLDEYEITLPPRVQAFLDGVQGTVGDCYSLVVFHWSPQSLVIIDRYAKWLPGGFIQEMVRKSSKPSSKKKQEKNAILDNGGTNTKSPSSRNISNTYLIQKRNSIPPQNTKEEEEEEE